MKTYYIDFALTTPNALEMKVHHYFPKAMCRARILGATDDYFEFTVFGVADLAQLERIVGAYVQGEQSPYRLQKMRLFVNRQYAQK